MSKLINKIVECIKDNGIDKLNELTLNLSIKEKEKIKDILDDKEIEVRICSNCGNFFNKGFVVGGGDEYYCNDECLHQNISEIEWEKMCAYMIQEEERTKEEQKWFNEYGDTESYYTELY